MRSRFLCFLTSVSILSTALAAPAPGSVRVVPPPPSGGLSLPSPGTVQPAFPSTVPVPVRITTMDWRARNYQQFLGSARTLWQQCGVNLPLGHWPDEVLFPSGRVDTFIVRQEQYLTWVNIVRDHPVTVWCGVTRQGGKRGSDTNALLNYLRHLNLSVTTIAGELPGTFTPLHRFALEGERMISSVIGTNGLMKCEEVRRAPNAPTGPQVLNAPACP